MAAKFREGHRAHYDDGHGVVAHDHDTKPTTRQTAILTLNGVKQYLRAHPERRSTRDRRSAETRQTKDFADGLALVCVCLRRALCFITASGQGGKPTPGDIYPLCFVFSCPLRTSMTASPDNTARPRSGTVDKPPPRPGHRRSRGRQQPRAARGRETLAHAAVRAHQDADERVRCRQTGSVKVIGLPAAWA